MISKTLKGSEKKKSAFDKIPDRIEDMSPLPSPSKKGVNGERDRRKYPFSSNASGYQS